jgi:hypothetical protein
VIPESSVLPLVLKPTVSGALPVVDEVALRRATGSVFGAPTFTATLAVPVRPSASRTVSFAEHEQARLY